MENTIDAIVLAGDRGGSRNFAGGNKNFLEIAGRPLLAHVIDALSGVDGITRIAIVGPAAAIYELLRDQRVKLRDGLEVVVLEQKDTAYQNFWTAFLHLLGDEYSPTIEATDRNVEEKAVLVVPGDAPLMRSAEITEFLQRCTEQDLDYGVGMTEERFLRRFAPRDGKPGVKMNYLHLSTGSFRLNNLHFARPFKVKNRAYIERIYEYRYQRQPMNMLRVVKDMLLVPGLGLRPIVLYIYAQLATRCFARGYHRMLALVRKRLTPEKVTRIGSVLLQARVRIVETSGGGCAIDVDNETDYETLQLRYDEFTMQPPGC
ncbi:MAG: nucleotidyltransferase family protein [Woeseiaceae bacterium]